MPLENGSLEQQFASTAEALQEQINAGTTPESQETEAAPAVESSQAAADEQVDPDKGETPDETTSESKPAEGRSPKLQKLIESKGGEDKLADSIFATYQSAAQLAKANEELKARLSQNAELDDVPEDQLVDPADQEGIQGLQQEIQSLQSAAQTDEARQGSALKELARIERELAKAEGALQYAQDYEKAEIRQAIAQLRADKVAQENSWHTAGVNKAAREREAAKLTRELNAEQRKLETAKQQRAKQVLASRVEAETFRATFDTTAERLGREYGIPEKSLAVLQRQARLEASAFLRTLPESSPGLRNPKDMEQFIAKVVLDYAADRGIARNTKFVADSQKKVAASKQVQQTGAVPPGSSLRDRILAAPKPTAKQVRDAKFWDERAASFLG